MKSVKSITTTWIEMNDFDVEGQFVVLGNNSCSYMNWKQNENEAGTVPASLGAKVYGQSSRH